MQSVLLFFFQLFLSISQCVHDDVLRIRLAVRLCLIVSVSEVFCMINNASFKKIVSNNKEERSVYTLKCIQRFSVKIRVIFSHFHYFLFFYFHFFSCFLYQTIFEIGFKIDFTRIFYQSDDFAFNLKIKKPDFNLSSIIDSI